MLIPWGNKTCSFLERLKHAHSLRAWNMLIPCENKKTKCVFRHESNVKPVYERAIIATYINTLQLIVCFAVVGKVFLLAFLSWQIQILLVRVEWPTIQTVKGAIRDLKKAEREDHPAAVFIVRLIAVRQADTVHAVWEEKWQVMKKKQEEHMEENQ